MSSSPLADGLWSAEVFCPNIIGWIERLFWDVIHSFQPLLYQLSSCSLQTVIHSFEEVGMTRLSSSYASSLSTLNTTTEVPLSKAPNPQLLPGHRSINGCPLLRVCVHGVCVFTAVCVHFGWVKCRAQIPSMGYHTWPFVTSLSLSLTSMLCSLLMYSILNLLRPNVWLNV